MTTQSETQPVVLPEVATQATEEIPPLRAAPPPAGVRLTGNVVAPPHRPRSRHARLRDRLGLAGPGLAGLGRVGPGLAGLGLAGLAGLLLEIGLARGFGTASLWSAAPLWSLFATASALLSVLAFAVFYAADARLGPESAWRVAAGGLIGLAVFWLLVVLPQVDTDRGFVLTAALASLGSALWIGPRRRS